MKKNKYFLMIILIILTTTSAMQVFASSDNFPDLNSSYDWAKPHIAKLTSIDLIEGYPDGTFRPDQSISVAELMKVLLLIGGEDVSVPDNQDWSEGIIEKAYYAELMSYSPSIIKSNNGMFPRRYAPKTITNAITKYLDEELQTIDARLYIRGFFDVSGEEQTTLANCVAMGIICGDENREFKPYNQMTRAEACVALARMIDKTLRVTPEKLTGIVEESWDNYIVESEYAKKYFNIQMQSGNTFTADMPTLYIGGRREAFVGEQAFEITETEKGHFSIDATDAQVDAITHVIYTRGINTAGEGAVGLRMYKYKIEGNPFR